MTGQSAEQDIVMEGAERPAERRSQPLPWILILLPVLYLASAGPLLGLNERGIISDSAWETLCTSVYAPLVWLETRTDFFDTLPGSAYMWYLRLFAP